VIDGLAKRSTAMADDGALASNALRRVWVERLDTGFCSTEIRRVGEQFSILVDSGLITAIDVASAVVARHFNGTFDVAEVTDDVRDGFGRFFTTFVAQYFLYGRIRFDPPPLTGFDPAIAARVAQESVAFMLGHELGHAMAGNQHFSGDHLWADADDVPDSLRRYAPEIEADAIGVQLSFGALWAGQPLGQAEVELRLFAVRMSFAILQTVEQCCLTSRFARHLPADQRWSSIVHHLGHRLPRWLIDKHNHDWTILGPLFGFANLNTVQAPDTTLGCELAATGWVDIHTDLDTWAEIEVAARHFRYPTPVLHALLGLLGESLDAGDVRTTLRPEHPAQGSAITQALLDRLPAWLGPAPGQRATTSVSDIIEYLRKVERWPEPFRAHPDVAPPIHLAAASIARRLQTGALTSDHDEPVGL
jgi:hypothetical protein